MRVAGPLLLCPALALALAGGCSCDDEAEELSVEGEHAFVRCHAAEAPEERRWRVGELALSTDDARHLRIENAPRPLRLAAFAGPGEGDTDPAAVAALEPHLVAVLGDLGPDPAGLLRELGELGVPVLVLAGGADRFEAVREAFDALTGAAADRVLDATVLRSVRVGPVELVPVAGAPTGRYAVGPGACGLAADDADGWALEEPADGVHRVLLAWAGPAGERPSSVTRGLAGVEAGSPLVAAIAEAAAAEAALFAWPRTQVGRAEAGGARGGGPAWDLRVAVPPLAGPALVRADGTRVRPHPILLRIGDDGLEVRAPDSP